MTIGKELGAVRSSTTCRDFVCALIGLGVIVSTDKNVIRKISGGISKIIYGYTSRGKCYAPLPANHKQWCINDQKIGNRIYEAMRTGGN
jgi:hypothetical protein